MGDINPSKMPKKKVIERKDDPNKVAMYKKGGQVKKFDNGGSIAELVKESEGMLNQADTGPRMPNPYTGQHPVMDVSQAQDDVHAFPTYINLDKDYQSIGGRLTGTKKLSRDAMLQAYLDADISRDDQGSRGRVNRAGINFIKNFAKGGETGLYANINAKRKRIAKGSNEKMRKPGAKGAPTNQAFINSAKTAKSK
jgi:hypothetical protein